MKILVTGSAGFIGFHFANKMISEGHNIIGLDNINDYYDIRLKYARLDEAGIDTSKIMSAVSGRTSNRFYKSRKFSNYKFIKLDLAEKSGLEKLLKSERFDYIIHLAAQAGVRHSINNPQVYIDSNILGFFNLLEACRKHPPKHLIFASSSSVYGNSRKVPFSENENTDHPVSLYAATKKSNEIMAYAYSSMYGIPVTGVRFFTVYGPWGRPDMAYFSFAKAIVESKPIKLFEKGKLKRDFTYIDDIIESLRKIMQKIPSNDPFGVKSRILNIGNNNPVNISKFISILEKHLAKKAIIDYYPIQKGDVYQTHADTKNLIKTINFTPGSDLDTGCKKFCKWYLEYRKSL